MLVGFTHADADEQLGWMADKVIAETGAFGATMEVELVNDGRVTLWLER